MVSIPSDEMSKSLHRLRATVLRALLFAGVAQLATSGDASGWKALLDDRLGMVEAFAASPASCDAIDPTDVDGTGTTDPFSSLHVAESSAEDDEVDAWRRRLNVRSAFPSVVLPKVFWEESIRNRIEDRRNCRPPNHAS